MQQVRKGEPALDGGDGGGSEQDLKLWKWRCTCGNRFVAPYVEETVCPDCQSEAIYIVGNPPEDLEDDAELVH